ncbi:MAG: thiopeptide-type bacteriocin biosynthesis protein [Bacteroidota bacterium]
MNQDIIRHPPGSDWLYLRIYGGPQALEEWLTGSFRLLLNAWIRSETVKLFYFVRYLDQDYHLRLRFRLADTLQSGLLLSLISSDCRNWLEDERMWKIEAGTYEPEVNRYGLERMSLIEDWFYRDSLFWLEVLADSTENEKSALWKTGVARIDWMLDRFGFSTGGKLMLLQQMRESLSTEFGINHRMKSQLDAKYRSTVKELAGILDHPEVLHQDAWESFMQTDSVIGQIKETFAIREELETSGVLPDMIHMSLNRVFRTRHRLQELVVYDFMARYYASAVAKGKT